MSEHQHHHTYKPDVCKYTEVKEDILELKATQQELAAIIRENRIEAERQNKDLEKHEIDERGRLLEHVRKSIETTDEKWETLKKNQQSIQEILNGNGNPEKGLVVKMIKLVWWVRMLTGVSILNVITQQGFTIREVIEFIQKIL